MKSFSNDYGNDFGRQTNELAHKRSQYYLGCAIIDFKHLIFEEPHINFGVRQFDPKNIDRLISIFEIEGCCNLEPEFKIAATIDSSAFANALSLANITKEQLLDPTSNVVLKLNDDCRLLCVYGKHRLRAAEAFGQSCWLVDIYLDDLPDVTRAQLREESSRSLELSDGEIYRVYRIYKNAQNEFQAAKWWAKLGSDRRRKWFSLLERKTDLFLGFECLLQYPGFWKIFNTAQIERLIKINCPEIIIQYLSDINHKWQNMIDPSMANLVDNSSVSLIEGMMPRQSLHDQTQITQLMETQQLFPYIKNPHERGSLKTRILAIKGRITSLNTLAQDILYIEHPTMALHHLCPGQKKLTLLAQMRRQWSSISRQHDPEFQISEHSFKTVPSARISFMTSIIQLWLYTLRHFVYDSPKITTSRDYQTQHQILTFQGLALLAKRLGFSSDPIDKILSTSQSRLIAKSFVDEISKDEFLSLNESHVKGLSSRFAAIMTLLRRNKTVSDRAAIFTTDSPAESAKRRFCRPVASQYREQRGNLFIEQIFGPTETAARYPTSLAITRDILICFFGDEAFDEIYSSVSSGGNAASPIDVNSTEPEPAPVDNADVMETSGGPGDEYGQKALDNESSIRPPPLPSSPSEESLHPSPVSLSPHPSGTPDHMTWEAEVPMAAGFEDYTNIGGLESKIYIAHHRKIPEILSVWHQSKDQRLVVVYLFAERIFYKYRAADTYSLRSFLIDLARDYILMEIHADYGLATPDMNKIWETALANHLLVACRKDYPSNKKPEGTEMSMDEFRSYVANYDVHTGKRNNEDEDERSAKRR